MMNLVCDKCGEDLCYFGSVIVRDGRNDAGYIFRVIPCLCTTEAFNKVLRQLIEDICPVDGQIVQVKVPTLACTTYYYGQPEV